MKILYFGELVTLMEKNQLLETVLSEPLSRLLVRDYVCMTGDDYFSHCLIEYNKRSGYRDIFIPGNLVPGLAEGHFLRQYRYALHINHGFQIKLIKPLFPEDRIMVIDKIEEAKSDTRLIIDNSSPVKIKRRIKNQENELTCLLYLDYLIRRNE
ncbi:MaoC family dehydratase [Candidatus Woesearchaeota archaeon]|nr:MaoC family dehydratase [Candidatus Woesearchaeota archaeon]